MRRYICREVEDPLAEKIIEYSQRAITQVRLSCSGDALQIDCM
jgi:ATP-dependent Clp protease ATP-binding subunit ClpA